MPTKKEGPDYPDLSDLAAGILLGGAFLGMYGIYRGIKYLTTDHENARKAAEKADWWRDYMLRARQQEEKEKERIARLKEIAAGRPFCERCGTINPPRCPDCKRCLRCTGTCSTCGGCLHCLGDSGGECNACSSD